MIEESWNGLSYGSHLVIKGWKSAFTTNCHHRRRSDKWKEILLKKKKKKERNLVLDNIIKPTQQTEPNPPMFPCTFQVSVIFMEKHEWTFRPTQHLSWFTCYSPAFPAPQYWRYYTVFSPITYFWIQTFFFKFIWLWTINRSLIHSKSTLRILIVHSSKYWGYRGKRWPTSALREFWFLWGR